MIEWTVTETNCGAALWFLEQKLPAAPTGYLRQLLRAGKVRRNQTSLAAEDQLWSGDRITLPESSRIKELFAALPPPQLDICYESRELIIVNKPPGLAVHRGKGHEEDNLQARLEQVMLARKAPFSIAPVHRLDLDTSGPVLFAKGRQAASKLGQLFIAGQAGKGYLTLVAGQVSGSGLLASPVLAKGKLKASATAFRAIAEDRGMSLVALELQTGRTHQIRRQLAAAGHPLAGDRRYHGPLPSGLPRIFLHCYRLTLSDPFSGSPIAVDCPLPEDLVGFLRQQHPRLWEALRQ